METKLCECGCGKPVTLYKTTDKRLGAVKGQPARFIKGHGDKGMRPLPFRPVKKCPLCNVDKPNTFEFYYRDKSRADGFSSRCKKCKDVENQAINATPEMRKWAKKYREEHKTESGAYNKKWYSENREYSLAESRKWRGSHPAEAKLSRKQWIKNNPEKARDGLLRCKQKRRAREAGCETGPINHREIYNAYEGLCGICDQPVSYLAANWDHIVPLDGGGNHVASNLQPTHKRCNSIKGNRTLEWARRRVKEIDYGGMLSDLV